MANTHDASDMAWTPAYISEANIGDMIRYTTQSLDFSTNPPTVLDSTHVTRVVEISRIWAPNTTNYVWVDIDSNSHLNGANYHIDIARYSLAHQYPDLFG